MPDLKPFPALGPRCALSCGAVTETVGKLVYYPLGRRGGAAVLRHIRHKELMKHMEEHQLGLRRLSSALEPGVTLKSDGGGCAPSRSRGAPGTDGADAGEPWRGGCAGTPLQRALAVRVELTWEHRLLSCAGDERQQPVVGDNRALGWLFWAGSKRG